MSRYLSSQSPLREIEIIEIGLDQVAVTVTLKGEPVEGAEVSLLTRGLIPIRFAKITGADGRVVWSDIELGGIENPNIIAGTPWLLFAYVPNSQYFYWEEISFELGTTYQAKLKTYKSAPTFFIKIEFNEWFGYELFSNFVAGVEKEALTWAGMKVTDVTGAGTKLVTVYFQPPWTVESPIVINWAAVWFILKVTAVALAVIGVLYMLRWTFGETGVKVISYAIPIAAVAVLTTTITALIVSARRKS